jgi:predicted transglutaminase-like cysteine proteinase
MQHLTTRFFLILLALFQLSLAFDANSYPLLFGRSEDKNYDIEEFPKWLSVLDKNEDEQKSFEKKCSKNSKKFYCNITEWKKFLDGLKNKKPIEQIKAINSYSNKHKYILDIDNWGISDYWESPGEFLFKNGDCEDYAIIKYMSLKYLGYKTDDLRVVVLMDNNLKIYHSVLAVYIDDKIYILDNQITKVTRDTNILHYAPVYSINENSWWRHI